MNDVDPNTFIGKRIGSYVITKFLGRGSFATVYSAHKQNDNQEYAIKVQPKALIEHYNCTEAFMTEVNVMININHPNCVHCEEFMQSADNYYLVMKVANNGDLSQYMLKTGNMHFDEKTAVYFLKQIMSGFMELRKYQIIHRDFKLENLFMNDTTLILGDFGSSAQYKQNCATYVGTTAYMAPEMTKAYYNRGVYDSKIDLWSVGVGYYKLLFGQFPFNATKKMSIHQDIEQNSGKNLKFHDDVNMISDLSKDLLKRILEEEPKQRISWEEFFKHELFDVHEDKINKQVGWQMSVAIVKDNKINDLFMQSKIDAAECEHDDKKCVIENLAEQMLKNNTDVKLVEAKLDDSHKQLLATEEIMKLNTQRYYYEKQKIMHIWKT